MMWWPLLFASLVFAQDDAVEKYCYASMASMDRSLAQLRAIAVPSDRIEKVDSCFVVTMRPHRRELIQNYLRAADSNVSISFSSSEIKTDPCHLKVEKIKTLNQQNSQGSISSSGIGLESGTSSATSKETLDIQTTKEFAIKVNQDAIKGECRVIGPTRYEITIQVRKDPKPALPVAAPGTVIVINPSPDQKTLFLTTQIQLQRGERVELGGLLRDLMSKSHEINAAPKSSGESSDTKDQEKIFLSIF